MPGVRANRRPFADTEASGKPDRYPRTLFAGRGELGVTRQAVYDKLKNIEPGVSAEVVRHSARELTPVLKEMKATQKPWVPGYRVLMLDGNHLAGTEHRIFELRRTRAAALPGQCLALYDPQLSLIVDVVPC